MSEKASSTLRCKWYLADDVKFDSEGKVILLGLYPDDTLIVEMPSADPDPSTESPIGVIGLSIATVVIGFHGEAEFKLRLIGAHHTSEQTHRLRATDNVSSVTIGSRFAPFLIGSFGEKRMTITCEELGFHDEYAFRVVRRNVAAAAMDGFPMHVALSVKK